MHSGGSHLNVTIVIKLLFLIVKLHLIRKHTLRRSHLNMSSVITALVKKLILFGITEHIMMRIYINVTSVINVFLSLFSIFCDVLTFYEEIFTWLMIILRDLFGRALFLHKWQQSKKWQHFCNPSLWKIDISSIVMDIL